MTLDKLRAGNCCKNLDEHQGEKHLKTKSTFYNISTIISKSGPTSCGNFVKYVNLSARKLPTFITKSIDWQGFNSAFGRKMGSIMPSKSMLLLKISKLIRKRYVLGIHNTKPLQLKTLQSRLCRATLWQCPAVDTNARTPRNRYGSHTWKILRGGYTYRPFTMNNKYGIAIAKKGHDKFCRGKSFWSRKFEEMNSFRNPAAPNCTDSTTYNELRGVITVTRYTIEMDKRYKWLRTESRTVVLGISGKTWEPDWPGYHYHFQ